MPAWQRSRCAAGLDFPAGFPPALPRCSRHRPPRRPFFARSVTAQCEVGWGVGLHEKGLHWNAHKRHGLAGDGRPRRSQCTQRGRHAALPSNPSSASSPFLVHLGDTQLPPCSPLQRPWPAAWSQPAPRPSAAPGPCPPWRAPWQAAWTPLGAGSAAKRAARAAAPAGWTRARGRRPRTALSARRRQPWAWPSSISPGARPL